jgi:hypothetical protein
MQYRSGLRGTQAIDVAIWCALGHSRVASVLRQSARLCSFEVVEAANIAPVVVNVRCLGSAEFEKLSGGSLRLSSQQNARGHRRQSSIRRMSGYGMTASVKVCGCRPHDGGAADTGAGVRKPPREETAGGRGRWCVRSYGGLVAGALLPKCIERVFGKRSRGRRTRSADRDRQNRRCASEIERQDGCP